MSCEIRLVENDVIRDEIGGGMTPCEMRLVGNGVM